MSEETNSEMLTSYANPNYSHVSSLLTSSTYDDEDENSLMLMKSDDEEGGSSALTALADAIHSLEMVTKDQEDERKKLSEGIDKSASACSSDSAFSSPLSDSSPLMKTKITDETWNLQLVNSKTNIDNLGNIHSKNGLENKMESTIEINNNKIQLNNSNPNAMSPDVDQHNSQKDDITTLNKDKNSKNEDKNTPVNAEPDKLYEDDDDVTPKTDKIIIDVLAQEEGDDIHEVNNTNDRKDSLLGSKEFSKADQQNNNTNDHDNHTVTDNITKNHNTDINTISNHNTNIEGWQKCEDASGAYYWHVKTGTIQRHPPTHIHSSLPMKPSVTQPDVVAETKTTSGINDQAVNLPSSSSSNSSNNNSKTETTQSSSQSTFTVIQQQQRRQQQYDDNNEELELPLRFAVRSLGWVLVNEEDLTREKSSHTVNKCIVDLSVGGKKEINDSIGKWGDGKYLYMDIDQSHVSLIHPLDLTILNTQAIKTLRVWGVGRENSRDFAYVARDKVSKAFTCHVFRCDQPARHIASALCHLCKMAVNKKNNNKENNNNNNGSGACVASGSSASSLTSSLNRPNKLPHLESHGTLSGEVLAKYEDLLKNSSFPTPMDEPKKLLHCHYLGHILVSVPSGIDVLNGAIDTLYRRVPAEKWKYVDVTIAPSTITIVEHELPDVILAESRVRFLSFLGISLKDAKLCAYIMHTAQDNFLAYVFYCEPSAGPLCKTIEAACKLRFQKCLDRKGLASDVSQTSEDQSGSQTIKIDIAEPLNYMLRKEEDEMPSQQYTYQPPSFTLTNVLPSRQTLLKAKNEWNKSVNSMRDGLKRAGSSISDKKNDLKQVASTYHIREDLMQSGANLKQGLCQSALALKNNLSQSAVVLKDSLHGPATVAKESTVKGFNNTWNFIARQNILSNSAKFLTSTYYNASSYRSNNKHGGGDGGKDNGGEDGDNVDNGGEDGDNVDNGGDKKERTISERSESGGDDDKGEFIDDDMLMTGDDVNNDDMLMTGDDVNNGDMLMTGDDVNNGDMMMNGDDVNNGDMMMTGDDVNNGDMMMTGDDVKNGDMMMNVDNVINGEMVMINGNSS